MNRDDMLENLHIEGQVAGSDFNDADHILGWFGWEINDGFLTVTYVDSVTPDNEARASWQLVPVDES